MFLKDTIAEHDKPSQTPSHNTTHGLKSMQMLSVLHLLRDRMGMSHAAASDVAILLPKHDSPGAYMSTFLHAAIEEQIDEYRKQSFAKFGLEISVYPSHNARQMELYVEHFDRVTVGYHSYVFKIQHNNTPKKAMHVRLHRGSIQVRFCDSWQPLSAFLDEIRTAWTYPESLELQLDRQYKWWSANGKFFEITKLPGEIRNAIFDSVFPSEEHPFPTSKKNNRLAPKYQHSYTALMRTNKQLNQEASDRFYRTTTFLIEHPPLFSKKLNKGIRLDRLRSVQLSLDHSQYLDLFSTKPWAVSTKPYVKRQFREMSNLESFEIHFSAPSRIATKTWLEGACQKAALDMIMDAAWPSIRGLPVIVTGYVKDSQKKAIESHIRSERSRYASFEAFCRDIGKRCSLHAFDSWVEWMMAEKQGGVRLDGEPLVEKEGEGSERLEWNNMATQDLRELMWCSCEKRCSLDDWDPAN
ncbi:hypothetical protein MBLNU13_g04145t1 [Cladosporium sp. NU13]